MRNTLDKTNTIPVGTAVGKEYIVAFVLLPICCFVETVPRASVVPGGGEEGPLISSRSSVEDPSESTLSAE